MSCKFFNSLFRIDLLVIERRWARFIGHCLWCFFEYLKEGYYVSSSTNWPFLCIDILFSLHSHFSSCIFYRLNMQCAEYACCMLCYFNYFTLHFVSHMCLCLSLLLLCIIYMCTVYVYENMFVCACESVFPFNATQHSTAQNTTFLLLHSLHQCTTQRNVICYVFTL